MNEHVLKTKEQKIMDAIFGLSQEDLFKCIVDLNRTIEELNDKIEHLEYELEESENEDQDIDEKCENCIMPECKTQYLLVELESVVSEFKRDYKIS